jgi:predicted GIY-YIG superfamily endonuclease
MKPISVNQIIPEIDAYIQKEGSEYGSWYAGITNDPRRRLFTDHNVVEKSWWIYREAHTVEDAR